MPLRSSRWLAAVAVVLAAVLAAVRGAPARAGLEADVGDRAPAFQGRAYVNTGPVDLRSLEGHVVLLEIFRTRNQVCRDQVALLDRLHERHAARGLVVISLTNEAQSAVEKFVEETGAKHAFVSERTDSSESYGVGNFPIAFLVDVDGVIAWWGRPENLMPDVLEREIRKVRLPPPLPDSLAPVRKLLDARRYGEARKALAAAAANEKTPEADRKAAAAAIEWIDARARRLTDVATVEAIKGEYVAAAEALDRLATEYRGTEAGDRAAKDLKEILSDPARRKEVEASRKLPDLKDRVFDLRPKKALEMLREFVASYPGTKAAGEAQKLIDQIVAAGEK